MKRDEALFSHGLKYLGAPPNLRPKRKISQMTLVQIDLMDENTVSRLHQPGPLQLQKSCTTKNLQDHKQKALIPGTSKSITKQNIDSKKSLK